MKALNNDIQESYCSFEVSKLLESKGCTLGEHRDGLITHALAIEWLRVNFGIWICANIVDKDGYFYSIDRSELDPLDSIYSDEFKTPQEATEAALKYVLEELI